MPLRILHVTPYYREAWAYGGIPRVVAALASAQAARGHQVTVWTTDAGTVDRAAGDGRVPWWRPRQATGPDGVSVHVFPNVSNRLAYAAQGFLPIGLRAHAARHAGGFDIAHLHACRNLPGAWAASALTRAGVPYVLAPNGTAPRLERFAAAKAVFDAAIGRTVLDRASRVVAVSEAERRQLVALGVAPSRIEVVGNPVDARELADRPPPGMFRDAAGLGSAPLVVFLGKLTPRKRVDDVISAFARLGTGTSAPLPVPSGPEPRLVIAGNDMGAGETARSLVRRLGISDRVSFTGLLEGPARLAVLADADVVVYPSEHEVFGLVPLEALLCGTPVVVAGDSGCGEVIASTGGGLVVAVGDVASLGAAVQTVLGDRRGWASATARARDGILRRFDAPVIAAALDDTYHRVLH
jgi:glycosyltransferase involved in cell wall biosynthesis